MPEEARGALARYLESIPLPLPCIVARPPREDEAREVGFLELRAGEGALFLKDAEGVPWRVSWERDVDGELAADRRRALPAGAYTVVGYRRIEREGDALWHLSVTGQKIRTIDVDTGAVQPVEIDATVRIARGLRGKMISMTIQGEGRSGLSVYKDGRRIPVRYRLVGPDGVEAEGPMRYG